MKVRNALPGDFTRILELNEKFVHFLSPMSLGKLRMLHDASAYHKVAETENGVEAFLLALREGLSYDSMNYLWFQRNLSRFLYIDRVVVAASVQGRGLGRLLYEDLFSYAVSVGISPITCEFDVDPPNEISRGFHQAFGFTEVGTHRVGKPGKRVSLQAAWPTVADSFGAPS